MKEARKPTPRELSAVWRNMAESNSPSFHPRDIESAVEKAVLDGHLPREAAQHAKAMAVYAEELLRERGRGQGGSGKETKRVPSHRHFVGGEWSAETGQEKELLKVKRTSERPDVKPVSSGAPDVPAEDAALIRKSLGGKAGKTLATMVIRADESRGLRPASREVERPLDFVGPMPRENPLERIMRRDAPEKPAAPMSEAGGAALAERILNAVKRSGVDTSKGVLESAGGKKTFFGFKKNPTIPRFYGEDTLETVLGPEQSDVFTGLGKFGKSAFDVLNAKAKAGDPDAALAFELLKRKMYKTGERFRRSQIETSEPRFRKTAKGFEPIMETRGGRKVQATETRTPEEKARRAARLEAIRGGPTATDLARARERYDPERERAFVERSMSIDQAQVLKRLMQKAREEEAGVEGAQGPITRDMLTRLRELAKQPGQEHGVPEEAIKKMYRRARKRTVPSPQRPVQNPNPLPDEGASRGRTANDVIDRLIRIARSRGVVLGSNLRPREVGPELPPVPIEHAYGPAGRYVVPGKDQFAKYRRKA